MAKNELSTVRPSKPRPRPSEIAIGAGVVPAVSVLPAGISRRARGRSAAGRTTSTHSNAAGGRRLTVKRYDTSKPGASIGTIYGNFLDQVELLRIGLPVRTIAVFQRSTGLSVLRITEVAGISAGTYSRRKQEGRLSPLESERVLRLSRVFERAVDLFRGDQASAQEWLETSIPSLGDQRPLDLARTEPGAREVEDLITRIQHGVVS